MHGLDRHRRALDHQRRPSHLARARPDDRRRRPARTGGRAAFRADQRQPHRFQQAAVNADVTATFRETIGRINALPQTPEFMLHTGDLSHLAEAEEFDTLEQLLRDCKVKQTFYVPGEHDILNDNGAQYLARFGKGTLGSGWHSFDQKGVHFIGLSNVANINEGGLGTLGAEQLDWLAKDVASLSADTPIVVFAHIPLWSVYPKWGWGTDDAEKALRQ